MERRLISNIRSALDNMDIKITRERGRLFVEALKESDALCVQSHTMKDASYLIDLYSFNETSPSLNAERVWFISMRRFSVLILDIFLTGIQYLGLKSNENTSM